MTFANGRVRVEAPVFGGSLAFGNYMQIDPLWHPGALCHNSADRSATDILRVGMKNMVVCLLPVSPVTKYCIIVT